jgi:carbon storage regulator
MLVLSRKLGESIYIGDKIEITVMRIQGSRIRIAIDAPAEIRILRGELDQWSNLASPVIQPTRVSIVTGRWAE